jgi:hypothetical protein
MSASLRLAERDQRVYRVVTPRFVAAAETGPDGRIRFGGGVFTAPVLRRFNGQSVDNLRRWARSLGGIVEELS